VREVLADNAATTHKLSFLTQAATPNLALKFPPTMSKDKALEWIELFEQEHRGADERLARRSTSAPASSPCRSG
jgi:hypothetical protein